MTDIIEHFHQRVNMQIRRFARRALLLDKVTRCMLPERAIAQDDLGEPATIARSSILFGLWMVVLVFGVFGLWSVLARIDSAAIATGRVILDENRKSISHLEGGIVDVIHVSVGDHVEEGDPLVTLMEIRARAEVDLLHNQRNNNLAIEARLIAERDKAATINFPEALMRAADAGADADAGSTAPAASHATADGSALHSAAADSADTDTPPAIAVLNTQDSSSSTTNTSLSVRDMLDNQQRIFTSRTENLRGQLDILNTRVNKHEQEIRGLDMQSASVVRQIDLLNEEIGVVEKLVAEGNATRPRLLALQRQRAELQGRQGEYVALRAKALENIDETRLTILNTESEYMSKVVEELKQTQQLLGELNERITASADILDRVVIRAPVNGVVNDLTIHTRGGVISPGEKILDIVPFSSEMTVEARVAPQDIDVVHKGLDARVRLTAFKARQVPPVAGTVTFVSGDQFVDERSGQSYFLARIKIDAEALSALRDVELSAGMPADVLIITGSRSFLAYLLDPITQSFRHSFRQD